MGCPAESRRLELATVPEDERSADLVWSRLGLRTDGRVIALNSIREIGRISGLSPAQPLIIVRPASFNETTAAAASVNTDKTASFR